MNINILEPEEGLTSNTSVYQNFSGIFPQVIFDILNLTEVETFHYVNLNNIHPMPYIIVKEVVMEIHI